MNERSPQQKKQLSYERDRRNGYGENSESSRKNIRLRKRGVNQANRHAHKQQLGVVDPETGEPQQDSGVIVRRPKRWRKVADIPLGDKLFTKFTLSDYSQDGWVHSLTTGINDGYMDSQVRRADILWTPTDNLSFRLCQNMMNASAICAQGHFEELHLFR